MHIVEQFIESKTGRMDTCEDALYVDENFVVIVDGATNKTSKLWDGKTCGQIAKECILNAIPHINPDTTPQRFFISCNEAIKNWYDQHNITIEMQYHINQRATASVIMYARKHRQLWNVGSGLALIGLQRYNNTKLIDDLLADIRSFFIASEIKNGKSEFELSYMDTGRELVEPLILRQMLFQNGNSPSEWNYYELDGFFSNVKGINVIDIPEDVNSLVLGSDGYPEIFPTLQQTEQFLKQLLLDDPLCYKRYKATKGLKQGNVSFDDRSYIRIYLND